MRLSSALLIALLGLGPTPPLFAAEVPRHEPEEALTEWRGEQVSDVVRVDSLFGVLAMAGAARNEMWFESHGIDPSSPAAQQLLAAALKLETEHSYRVPDDLPARFQNDERGLAAWFQERNRARFSALGTLFGEWLAAREDEGLAVAPLIDRLLEDSNVVQFTSGEPADLEKSSELAYRAFSSAIQRELPELPTQFRQRRPQ